MEFSMKIGAFVAFGRLVIHKQYAGFFCLGYNIFLLLWKRSLYVHTHRHSHTHTHWSQGKSQSEAVGRENIKGGREAGFPFILPAERRQDARLLHSASFTSISVWLVSVSEIKLWWGCLDQQAGVYAAKDFSFIRGHLWFTYAFSGFWIYHKMFEDDKKKKKKTWGDSKPAASAAWWDDTKVSFLYKSWTLHCSNSSEATLACKVLPFNPERG